ncbi:MAG: sigma-70 family RNA polymerase sigma factor [Bacteroidales bacterium]
MKEFTDSEIIECLRNRQSYVVRYMSDRYLPMIRLMVVQMGGTPEEAKDIFQEGLLIMLEKIDNHQFKLTCKFKTFLYCVCENLWKSVVAKRKSETNYFNRRSAESEPEDFTEIPDHKLRKKIFLEAYESLDSVGKAILKLSWEEINLHEVAEKMGYSYGYIRKKKCVIQAELINRIKNHPDFKMMALG